MDELAKRFADLAQQYGPSVVDAAKSAARTEAYSCLMSSTISFGIAAIMFLAGRSLWRAKDWEDEEIAHCIGFVLIALAIIPFAIGTWNWIDPWTWTTIASPETWIAHKILKI